MLGDFGQHTKHTHAFVLEAYGLVHPIPLLIAAAAKLQCTLGQRLNQLRSDDILLQVNWSHLPQTLQLLHASSAMQSQAPLGTLLTSEADRPTFHCKWCHLRFDSIPNLRRHETQVHYCILCGTFHNRPQDLNLHLKTQHSTRVPNVQVKAMQLCRSQASNSPCRFC